MIDQLDDADDGGVGMAHAEGCELVFAGGCGEERFVVADDETGVVGEPGEQRRGLAGTPREGVVRLSRAARERGVRDRAVAGATAQVAGEPVVHNRPVRAPPRVVKGEEAHHESGGAEPALRRVQIDHGALHGMQRSVGGSEIFHGDDFGPVDHSQKQDAAIHRLVAQATVSVEAPDRDGAGTAVALRTAFLGAARAFPDPEMVEQSLGRGEVAPFDDTAAADEANAVAGHGSASPVGRVPVGGEQQRDVIVLVGVGDAESDGDLVEEERVRADAMSGAEVRTVVRRRAPSPAVQSSMSRPAAGVPAMVSRTCVVSRPICVTSPRRAAHFPAGGVAGDYSSRRRRTQREGRGCRMVDRYGLSGTRRLCRTTRPTTRG